ncbi:Hpt domain-containing protein [Rubidibacter lacunae]|uniref:Hpt domain-containing protein n=1 Tax=Rubidibacter lacunae TaxID=582514 RepID=UPI000429E716|nr:Hpt domain-containing protein [Rubidibacter lacunae]
MSTENQQRILGYFIEEAREHLTTLEKGLLNLSEVICDQEEVNELFRAAHSIKGGGGMLGYTSIQKTAHRFEDAFKFLQENRVTIDSQLESLFLSGLDALQELIDKLEEPSGLQAEEAARIVQAAEPKFDELQQYLERSMDAPAPAATPAPAAAATLNTAPLNNDERANRIRALLRKMLAEFKQADTSEGRRILQDLCDRLEAVTNEGGWVTLVQAIKIAAANPQYSYSTLAPVAIKELKGGSDLLELERAGEIAPSEALQRLGAADVQQVLLPVEPHGATEILRRVFNPQQLDQIAQLLVASR